MTTLSKFRMIISPYMDSDRPMVYRQFDDESDAMLHFESFVVANESTQQFLDTLIDAFDSRILIIKLECLSDMHTYHIIRMESITHSP